MRVPTELVLDILDAFVAEDDAAPTHSRSLDALRNCSLVCRRWSLPAQKRLIRSVYLAAPTPGSGIGLRPVIKKFQLLLSVLTGESTTSQKALLLSRSILSFTLLENSTFQEPWRSPLLRVSPENFALFLSLTPNIYTLKVKSGLLYFDKRSLALLSSATESDDVPLARVRNFSVVEERAAHQRYIEKLLCSELLPSMSSLSWLSYEGVSPDSYASTLFPPDVEVSELAPSPLPPIRNGLKSLNLDFRGKGPSLGLLYTLLRTSIEQGSLTTLNLPHLPQITSIVRATQGNDAQQPVVSGLSDIIRLLQPSLKELSLGSPPAEVGGGDARSLLAQQHQGGAFLAAGLGLGAALSEDPLDLREAAPQLETLMCTSYPLDSILLGPPRPASSFSLPASVSASSTNSSSSDTNQTHSPSSSTSSRRSRLSVQGMCHTSRLPANLKHIEIRLAEKSLRNAGVWARVVDAVYWALSADDVEYAMSGGESASIVQSVLLELPLGLLDMLKANEDPARGQDEVVVPAGARLIGLGGAGSARLGFGALESKHSSAASSSDSGTDVAFRKRVEALRSYCALRKIALELRECESCV